MASLRQEQHYGLSCGKNTKNNPNRTLYHVKLTDSALRALEAFQNIKGSIHCEPSICFKGSQGYIKIPTPTSEAPTALRVFSFYLSTDSKDQPQASFDCIHQYASSDGHEQLEGQGIIQDKITVCATDDSYQTTRERVSQVEKDSWNRSVIEIKPGHPGWSSKFPKRNVQSLPGPDSSFLKQPIPNRRVSGGAGLSSRRLRERIIHLLALKPYRKPELLLWLEKERANPKDKAELGAVLEEVAKLNPKDNNYCLQDVFYKNVQKDWPGYSEDEKQLIGRVLARKLPINCQSRNLQATTSVQTSPDNINLHQIPKKNPNMKRPVPPECSQEKILAKRQKLLTKRLPQEPVSQDLNTPSLLPSFHTKTEFQRTCNLSGNQNNSLESSNSIPLMHKVPDAVVSDTVKQDPKISSSPWIQAHPECTKELLANHQHKKKKSKKHKDRERERLKDSQTKWLDTSADLKQSMDKLDNPDIKKEVASDEKPDYILLYSPIINLEQRERYQADFCAEYDEYKDLHSRIATITHMFVQLGAKIKSLSPGTKEYKIMEDQILEKYSKYKKKFPGYREEKKRCEYLHEKLSYIKQLITDFDIAQAS
ncbi:RNA polymerase II elongation factor ELL2-like isoform X1 [Periophthalmus magnuspinnatus]|uniref:RNA polymerase II elongation factor ELL2-like isoform X1 n=1 Tax=Periophthalmus magnuspinnatus TaxID=409849 RepID=UPI00145C0A34|nr:RNA polymerase II elongation factor ELL2-like isoform X1 [Periophthalmus magnuspinnatus]